MSRAQAEHPALSVGSELAHGDPVETLVRWSARACLMVVGDRDGCAAAEVGARSLAPAPFAFAFEEAQLRGAPLVACYVPAGPGSAPDRPTGLLAEALDGWPARYPDVEVRQAVLAGSDVAGVLCEASDAAGLAVVGAHGYRTLRRNGLGPVTRTLIDTAGCPVAVIPERATGGGVR